MLSKQHRNVHESLPTTIVTVSTVATAQACNAAMINLAFCKKNPHRVLMVSRLTGNI